MNKFIDFVDLIINNVYIYLVDGLNKIPFLNIGFPSISEIIATILSLGLLFSILLVPFWLGFKIFNKFVRW